MIERVRNVIVAARLLRGVALKKTDLYSSLWASVDQLRGGMETNRYKDYNLTLLFLKYVSDNAKAIQTTLSMSHKVDPLKTCWRSRVTRGSVIS